MIDYAMGSRPAAPGPSHVWHPQYDADGTLTALELIRLPWLFHRRAEEQDLDLLAESCRLVAVAVGEGRLPLDQVDTVLRHLVRQVAVIREGQVHPRGRGSRPTLAAARAAYFSCLEKR